VKLHGKAPTLSPKKVKMALFLQLRNFGAEMMLKTQE
jgi:hypothetical protein